MTNSASLLLGEIKCWSLLGFKGLTLTLMKTTENFRNAEAGWVFNSLNLHGEHKELNGKEERSLMKISSSSFT